MYPCEDVHESMTQQRMTWQANKVNPLGLFNGQGCMFDLPLMKG